MNLPDIKTLAQILGGEVSGGQALVPGPGHSPKDRSLSIKIDPGAPDGFVVTSFSTDDPLACKDYVRERLGVPQPSFQRGAASAPDASIARMSGRVSRQSDAKPHGASPPAEYIYRQADGVPYLRVKRTQDKQFYQSHWNGSGWVNGAPKGPKIPYRLPDLLGAIHDTVFVVEGEKDADALADRGFVATTNPAGAEKWTADLNEHFSMKTVYILPDNDEPGERHAEKVAQHLHGIAREVRIVRLPGLPEKGDVSDWIAAGGDTGRLVEMCKAAPVWAPEGVSAQTVQKVISATPFQWRDPRSIPRREWLYGWHLIRKFASAKIAAPGVGKSTLALTEAIAMATGRPLLGIRPRERCRVWYWNGEDPRDELERRIAAICLHFNIAPEELQGWFFYDSGRDAEIILAHQTRDGTVIAEPIATALAQTINENRIDVFTVDPFISSHRVTENDNNAIDLVAKKWSAVADETNCAVELVHHTRKTGGAEATVEDGRGAGALLAAVRSAQVLNRMTADEGTKAGVDNHREYFKLENGKANLSPPAEAKDWYRIVSVHLGNGGPGDDGDSVGVATKWRWPDHLEGVTGADFEAAAVAIRAGRWRESIQAKDWVGKPIARALNLDLSNTQDKAKVRGLVGAWISSGSLVIVEGQDDKRMPRKYVEVADAA